MDHEPQPPPGEQVRASPETLSPAGPAPPPWVVGVELPAPQVVRPFLLRPSFWWALWWCVGLLLFTQLPAAIVAAAVLVYIVLYQPEAVRDLSSPAVQGVVALAVVVAHGLIIAFSLLVLRIVAGR